MMDRIDTRPVYDPDYEVADSLEGERGMARNWKAVLRDLDPRERSDDWWTALQQVRLQEIDAAEADE